MNRTADIVFTRAKLAVFIDGCFWHGCEKHYVASKSNTEYWDSKIEKNMQRDLDTERRLLLEGWRVLRFWEHEEPAAIADAIMFELDSIRSDMKQ